MQVRTRHTPAFSVARLMLAPGELVHAEGGAMVATSYGVTVEARAQGGMLKALAKTAFGGTAAQLTTFTAPFQGGWVDVAPKLPGDVHSTEMDGSTNWCITKSCWLASSATVRLDAQWPGFRALFGGDSGFLTRASGMGALVIAFCGAMDVINLQQGEFVTVDCGHLVAYADTVQTRLRAMGQGISQSIRTGEGLVFDFAGPGQVLTQTRSPRELVTWMGANGLAART